MIQNYVNMFGTFWQGLMNISGGEKVSASSKKQYFVFEKQKIAFVLNMLGIEYDYEHMLLKKLTNPKM